VVRPSAADVVPDADSSKSRKADEDYHYVTAAAVVASAPDGVASGNSAAWPCAAEPRRRQWQRSAATNKQAPRRRLITAQLQSELRPLHARMTSIHKGWPIADDVQYVVLVAVYSKALLSFSAIRVDRSDLMDDVLMTVVALQSKRTR